MKKMLKLLTCSLMAIAIALTFTACAGNIDGTYKAKTIKADINAGLLGNISFEFDFDKLEESLDDLSEMEKLMIEGMVEAYEAMEFTISGDEISSKDGETNKFKRDGKNIIILDEDGEPDMSYEDGTLTFKVVKKTLEMHIESEDGTIVIIFVKQ